MLESNNRRGGQDSHCYRNHQQEVRAACILHGTIIADPQDARAELSLHGTINSKNQENEYAKMLNGVKKEFLRK